MVKRYFLIIALIFSSIALIFPPLFTWGKGSIPYLLGVIMFGMGLTLEGSDFIRVWTNRISVILGVCAQYTIMPLLAWMLSWIFNLSEPVMIGMVLLGACPGGTASNVIVYLSRGNVALSVTMTLLSTLVAPLVTPSLVLLFVGEMIHVPFWNMVMTVFWIVVLPIIGGALIRHFFQTWIGPILHIFPQVSMMTIAFVIGVIMGLNQKTILQFPMLIILAVILHNVLGLSFGYLIGKIFSRDVKDQRAIAIEVGMQNSGLAVSLATTFFTAQSALPGALFSLWHNLSGIGLAKYWSDKKNNGFHVHQNGYRRKKEDDG